MELVSNTQANIEYLENIIRQNKYAMLQLNILHSMNCHDNYNMLTYSEKDFLLKFIYTVYLKDENKIDLSVFSDAVMSNYKAVLDKSITKENIYNFL